MPLWSLVLFIVEHKHSIHLEMGILTGQGEEVLRYPDQSIRTSAQNRSRIDPEGICLRTSPGNRPGIQRFA
jgi:hypothetical protein